MRVRTNGCKNFGHPEICVSYESGAVADVDVAWLLGWIEAQVAAGTVFRNGQTVQIGWMITRLHAEENGDLALHEPDMVSNPAVFVDSISATLSHLRLQKAVAESYGLVAAMMFPSPRQSVVVCNRFDGSSGFFMERTTPDVVGSGWFMGCYDASHSHSVQENIRCMSLYEAACRVNPKTIPFLALPDLSRVAFRDGNKPQVCLKGAEIEPKPGSYMDQLLKSQQQPPMKKTLWQRLTRRPF